uniref:ribonuclease H n=1 Tax=Sparus aurata TaxID=8175 RepID=A0A671V7Q1_SPAAU
MNRMSKPLYIQDNKSGKQAKAPVVISPDCPINLLGRDLMQLLQIELKGLPASLRTKGPEDVGLMTTAAPVQIKPKSDWRPRVRQYPLIADALAGIQPVIKQLLHAGVIRECPDSPCNTPIFPGRKADGTNWRMVQDLRQINEAVQSRTPLVPDPHTLLNTLRPENTFFTVIDLSNAFFYVPVHPDSQFWFAFTYAGKSYTYTILPQGYCDSPTIFTQAINSCLSNFDPPRGSQDDLPLPHQTVILHRCAAFTASFDN